MNPVRLLIAGGVLGLTLCTGALRAAPETYEEWNYGHKTRVLSPASGAVVPVDADLRIQIAPVPGATHYACVLNQYIPKGSRTHEWSNANCGGAGLCYPPSTTPSCLISASDLVGNFEAGAATITVWAGRNFPTESGLPRYALGDQSDEVEITLSARPSAGATAAPASPFDAAYEPWFVDRSTDSPFRCTGESAAKLQVRSGRFSFYVFFDQFGKTEDYREVPLNARIRVDGIIQPNGVVGPLLVPLSPANAAAVQSLGGAGSGRACRSDEECASGVCLKGSGMKLDRCR